MTKEAFSDALDRAARGHQFIMIGDRHDKPEIAATFFSQETYDVLKRQGVKHIFLETPVEMQRYYDQYSAGKITRDQFVQTLSRKMESSTVEPEQRPVLFGLHADLLDRARVDGIHVYCANERYKMVSDMRKDPAVMRDYRQNAPLDIVTSEKIDLVSYLLSKKTERMPDGTMVSPLMSDQRVAGFITGHAGSEKAAVFYGSLHLTTTHGMDEIIGKDKSATVIITAGPMDRLTRKYNDLVAGRLGGAYHPDSAKPTLSYDINSNEAAYGELKTSEPAIDMRALKQAPEVQAAPAAKPPRPAKGHSLPKP